MKTRLTTKALTVLIGSAVLFAWSTFAADSTNQIGEPLKVIVTLGKKRVHIGEKFKIEVKVENVTNTNQLFGVWLCSWDAHYVSDNANVCNIASTACLRNFPIKVILPPGKSYTNRLTMKITQSASSNSISFKMGFRPFVVGKDRGGGFFDVSLGKTYWSDAITIKLNPKLIPDWIPW